MQQCLYPSFDGKTPFLGAKAMLTCCICADLCRYCFCFGNLEEMYP